MGEVLLLILVALWLAGGYVRDHLAEKRETERLARTAALRRQMLARTPDSPAAHELLGDALRASGDLEEAAAAYETARALAQDFPAGAGGAGIIPGAGLENKLRLARLELAEERSPGAYGRTLRTRQSVCRTCGALLSPQARNCPDCGAVLPVDSVLDTLRDDAIRRAILRETAEATLLLALVAAALIVASWMPLEVRIALAVAALIVVPLRLLKKIGDA